MRTGVQVLSCGGLGSSDGTITFHKCCALIIWLFIGETLPPSHPNPPLNPPPNPTQPNSTVVYSYPSPTPTGEANTELLRDTSGGEFDDLVSAPRMVLEQYIRTQVLDLSFNQFLVYTITKLEGSAIVARAWARVVHNAWHQALSLNHCCAARLATWCLHTKISKPCCSNPASQFPLDRGGADTQELDSLEYQVGG